MTAVTPHPTRPAALPPLGLARRVDRRRLRRADHDGRLPARRRRPPGVDRPLPGRGVAGGRRRRRERRSPCRATSPTSTPSSSSIDGALKPVPGATRDISGSLVAMRGNLEKVDGSLKTTSGSLTTTAGALSATRPVRCPTPPRRSSARRRRWSTRRRCSSRWPRRSADTSNVLDLRPRRRRPDPGHAQAHAEQPRQDRHRGPLEGGRRGPAHPGRGGEGHRQHRRRPHRREQAPEEHLQPDAAAAELLAETPVTSSRLAKVVLAILGVWGLLAGLMLIRTLLATKQIDKRVAAITTSLSEIDKDSRVHRPDAGDQPPLRRAPHRLGAPARHAGGHAGCHRRAGRQGRLDPGRHDHDRAQLQGDRAEGGLRPRHRRRHQRIGQGDRPEPGRASWPRSGRRRRRRGRSTPRPGASTPPWRTSCR